MARYINENTLDPHSGNLKLRLDDESHYPVLSDAKRPCCGLCRWVEKLRDIRVRGANVVSCDKCWVSLCISCFKPFHTIADIKKLKEKVLENKEIKKEKED